MVNAIFVEFLKVGLTMSTYSSIFVGVTVGWNISTWNTIYTTICISWSWSKTKKV